MKVLAKRFVPILLVLGIVWLALPVWGADKNKDEETIRNADHRVTGNGRQQGYSSQHSREG